MNYDETFFSKLNSDIQEKLFLEFKKATNRDKLMLFIKAKYGDEFTFKELSEKMHFTSVRSIYINCIENIKSGLIADNICISI